MITDNIHIYYDKPLQELTFNIPDELAFKMVSSLDDDSEEKKHFKYVFNLLCTSDRYIELLKEYGLYENPYDF